MQQTKASAIVSLLLVFVSGALVGVLSYRAYSVSVSPSTSNAPRKRDPVDWRKHYIAEMKSRVQLDDAQVAQLNEVFNQTDVEFRQSRETIQATQTGRINAMLRPEQRELFRKFLDEREAQRQQWRREMEKRQGKK